MLTSKNLKDFFFLITIGVLFIGFFYVLSPYIGLILIALILVELFYPWYLFLLKKLKSTHLASFIAGLSVILTVVIPALIVLLIVVIQASNLFDNASSFWRTHDLISEYKNIIDDVNNLISKVSTNPENQITSDEVRNYTVEFSKSFLNLFIDGIKSTATGAIGMVSKLIMLIVAIFSLFSLRDRLYETFKSISPLEDRLDDLFLKKFTETIRAVAKGTFVVAVGFGVIGGFFFFVLGIEAPVFWGLLMTVFSIIPIGSGIVWIPVSIYLIATGEIAKGIVLFLAGLIMTNGVDTFLRGRLIKSESQIHPLLLAFSILGGLETFGPLGFVYGPLIAVFFLSMMEVYKEKYRD